ncbi:type IV secretion system protein TraC [Legionella oakridgensis]|uniref:Type-IV secretion system protein TraC n=1 Tax=Legionella oakridgensis ATCC 33761 = DSM 21215 TaxID=1268635 RepID=W0BJA3_9GAMM|nr:type IV secretion system protein TraC [Legionella oakridgensis]AHE68494.1 type-IV secretion system protein TraC [Legionella oakridgensis ATCC 33761 = DSM 21215]STY41385.1 F pilus assembly protein TraC [Legionella longbeachae]
MGLNLADFRDKARDLLHRAATLLGETSGIKPASLHAHDKAHESCALDLPSIKAILPYETANEAGFFVNRNSMGFGLMLMPMSGADESLMNSLSQLFKNKLTVGTDCTVLLYKHPWLGTSLSQNYEPILKQGGIYAELARQSLKYHLNAIKKGYKNGRNVPAGLGDYCCYLFVSRPIQSDVEGQLHLLQADFESELKVAGFGFKRCEEGDFKVLMRVLISPDFNELSWPAIHESDGFIAESIPCPSTVIEIEDEAIGVSIVDSKAQTRRTRLVNCELSAYPSQPFALWQTPDLFANLLDTEQGIQCPFLISFTIRGVNQEKVKARAKARAKSLSANNNAVQGFINPSIREETAEWQFVHDHASKGELHLLPTFYNVVLYTSEEKEREHVAKAIASFRQMGFTLTQSRCKQWLRFLGSLPFMLTEGLFSSLDLLGMTKKLSHANVANLLPVVADFKGARQGLIVPTYRHQLFYLNTFDDRVLPITNFNRLTVASTGAGKSFFEQAQILDGLSRGQQIFVIDLGGSYKHLCEMVGGSYIDASTLALNPFTLFDFDGVTEIKGEQVNDYIQIRDLLAIMASPSEALGEVQKSWLLDAVTECWKARGRQAKMDDVLIALQGMLERQESQGDQRLKDLLILLGKYGSQGIYGHLFNSDTPLLNGSNLVVLEMGELESNPELLTIVMFVMIVIIQGQFYHSDRKREKRCVIDEAWRFLARGSNPVCASFIEQGFRTARKHMGGFAVITQNLVDTMNTIQGRAIAASSDTKIIMRQGSFKQYIEEHPRLFNPLEVKVIESFGEAKTQGFSNLMIQFGNVTTFHRYFCDPFSRVLFSTSGEEVSLIESLTNQGVNLSDAIQRVANNYYGEELCD